MIAAIQEYRGEIQIYRHRGLHPGISGVTTARGLVPQERGPSTNPSRETPPVPGRRLMLKRTAGVSDDHLKTSIPVRISSILVSLPGIPEPPLSR